MCYPYIMKMPPPAFCRFCGAALCVPVSMFNAYYECGTKRMHDKGGWRQSVKCKDNRIAQLERMVKHED